MNNQKLSQVVIYSSSVEVSNWLQSTIKLTSIIIENAHYCSVVSGITNKTISLIIVTEEKFKSLHAHLKNTNTILPILVVTKEFNGFTLPKSTKLTIDTIPLQAITIGLFEHAIKSVMQDFELNQRLTKLAHYDPLTGAANRLLFNDRLIQALKFAKRNNRAVSILCFDLDDFKPINDSFGHDVGDELLKRFVKLISSICRETDTIARFGGDEFILLLPDTSAQELVALCNKIVDKMSIKQHIKNHDIEIKSSIGATSTLLIGDLKETAEGLLKMADKAVYSAKKIPSTNYILN